jgi:hypothetical protein
MAAQAMALPFLPLAEAQIGGLKRNAHSAGIYSAKGCAEQSEAHRSRLMRLVPRHILQMVFRALRGGKPSQVARRLG